MNWVKVEKILKDCTKGTSQTGAIPEIFPSDYADFLTRFDGIEGFIGPEQYLSLWSSRQVQDLNVEYSVPQYLPGVVLIGTDGGGTGFGFDLQGRYVSSPLIGMSPTELVVLGGTFEEFLERLSSPLV